MTLRGPRSIPAMRQCEKRFSSEPSSNVFTTTAFFPAKRPARTITTFPLSVMVGGRTDAWDAWMQSWDRLG